MEWKLQLRTCSEESIQEASSNLLVVFKSVINLFNLIWIQSIFFPSHLQDLMEAFLNFSSLCQLHAPALVTVQKSKQDLFYAVRIRA